jgi:hypothetical protein
MPPGIFPVAVLLAGDASRSLRIGLKEELRYSRENWKRKVFFPIIWNEITVERYQIVR